MTTIENVAPPRTRTYAGPRVLTAAALALILALTGCGGSAKPAKQDAGGGSAHGSSGATAPGSSSSPTSAPAGSTGGGQTSQPGGGFCSLLTASEAQAIVATALTPGMSRTATGIAGLSGSCLYKAAKPDLSAPTVVQVIVLGTKVPRSVYESELKHNPRGGSTTPVPGLGEDAFAIPGVVTLFDHGLVLSLEAIKGGRPVDTAAIVALIRTAFSRAGSLK